MTTGYGQKFDGRIEGQQIKGQLVGYCAYILTWRKQGSVPRALIWAAAGRSLFFEGSSSDS